MSEPKEPHFFTQPDYASHFGSYTALFQDASQFLIRGESSTTYMHFPGVPERIAATTTEVRFIFLLRNPIDRIESHYAWLCGMGIETRPFRDAFLADFGDLPNYKNSHNGTYFYYAAESRYGEHIGRFANIFGMSKLLVLTTEELRSSPQQTIRRCTDFLSVLPVPELETVWANPSLPRRGGVLAVLAGGAQPRSRPGRALHGQLTRVGRPLMGINAVRAGRERLRRKVSTQRPRLVSDEDRMWLRQLYSPDVALLRMTVGQSFEEWSPDFPLNPVTR